MRPPLLNSRSRIARIGHRVIERIDAIRIRIIGRLWGANAPTPPGGSFVQSSTYACIAAWYAAKAAGGSSGRAVSSPARTYAPTRARLGTGPPRGDPPEPAAPR